MKFGIREICNVTLRAKNYIKLGKKQFFKDEPVFYFDSLKTSTMEGASSTVYAQGGRGNARLVAWEGDRTVTFTMEDALASPETLSLITGAVLNEGEEFIHAYQDMHKELKCYSDSASTKNVKVPTFVSFTNDELKSKIPELSDEQFLNLYLTIEGEAEPYIITQKDTIGYFIRNSADALSTSKSSATIELWSTATEKYTLEITKKKIGESTSYTAISNVELQLATKTAGETNFGAASTLYEIPSLVNKTITAAKDLKTSFIIGNTYKATIPVDKNTYDSEENTVLAYITNLDYYYKANCKTIEIGPEINNQNYYLEAETLFRDAATGFDYPANFVLPNCRLQSNFTLAMANSGDPGTFTFTIDAFPGYIKGNSGTKVMAAIQLIETPESDFDLNEQRKATPYNNIS